MNLAAPSNTSIADGQGMATILNDDSAPPSLPSLSISNEQLSEGDRGRTTFAFTVNLSAASTETGTVQYFTEDGSASAGSDYKAASGMLTFNPGVTSLTIKISVYTDRTVEVDETFFLKLSNPTNALIAVAQGIGTIVNDD